jgi:hypothetical protein
MLHEGLKKNKGKTAVVKYASWDTNFVPHKCTTKKIRQNKNSLIRSG